MILLLIFFSLKFAVSFLSFFSFSLIYFSKSCWIIFSASFLSIFSVFVLDSGNPVALALLRWNLPRLWVDLFESYSVSLSCFFFAEKTSYCASSSLEGTLRLTRIAPCESFWLEFPWLSKWLLYSAGVSALRWTGVPLVSLINSFLSSTSWPRFWFFIPLTTESIFEMPLLGLLTNLPFAVCFWDD